MVNELSVEQYKSTMIAPMIDVTETAEALVDIWPYINNLVVNGIVTKYVYDNELVEFVYRNGTATHEHILLPTANKNKFIVIIVDLIQLLIVGYYNLDLKKEYGLDE